MSPTSVEPCEEPTWQRVSLTSGLPICAGSPSFCYWSKPRPGSAPRHRRGRQTEPRPALPAAPAWRLQVAAGLQAVGQAFRFVERPRLEGGHKLDLTDDAVLEGEQSEEKMAAGGAGHSDRLPKKASPTPRRPRSSIASVAARGWYYHVTVHGSSIPPSALGSLEGKKVPATWCASERTPIRRYGWERGSSTVRPSAVAASLRAWSEESSVTGPSPRVLRCWRISRAAASWTAS